jgi:hypothetical protein
MYAVQTPGWFGSRRIALGPDGLYASPGWEAELEPATLADIVRRLTTLSTQRFIWNVRFDHEPLAAGLIVLGLTGSRNATHVLHLVRDYEEVFAGFNRTIRNQIRQALRKGVHVRLVSGPDDVRAYYDVHTRLAEQQGTYTMIYPLGLFLELVKLHDDVRFLVAECDGRVVSGGIFFRDGGSVMHWHGATDRAYSKFFPPCAILGEAIRWACESGATTFNLGGSAGIASLEQFKSFWGARPALNWQFTWTSPYWAALRGGVARLRALKPGRFS